MEILEKGDILPIKDKAEVLSKVYIGLEWPENSGDLDLAIFAVNASGQAVQLAYYADKVKPWVKLGEDNQTGNDTIVDGVDTDDETADIDLSQVPSDVMALIPTVNIYSSAHKNFGSLTGVTVVLRRDNVKGKKLGKFSVDEALPQAVSLAPAAFVRKPDGWAFVALGEGFRGPKLEDINREMVDFIRRHKILG